MIFSVIKRELTLRRNSLLVLCTVVALLAILYTTIFPSIQQQATQLMHSLKNVYKAVGIQGAPSFKTLFDYMALEMFAVTWPIIVTILVAGQAGASLAGETEKGSLAMLLALPIKRASTYFGKYLAGVVALIAFIVATLLPIPIAASIGGMSYHLPGLFTMTLMCLLFGLAVFSISLMLSALFNERGKVYGLSGGLLLIMYVFNIVSGLNQQLNWLKYLSFFHYFNAQSALGANHIALASFVMFLLVSVAAGIVGLLSFRSKDIAV